MTISISSSSLEVILAEIKDESISIDVFLNSKEWSGEYCEIEEIKQLMTSQGRVPIMILNSPAMSGWQLIPLEAIEAIRLDKPFNYLGEIISEFTIYVTDIPLAIHA